MTLNYAAALYALDDSDLDVYQSRVWLRVLRRGVCFESQRSMAKSMGVSLGKVNQALQWLLENGWIVRDIDEKTSKMGFAAVLPDEQTQQNFVSPDERSVLPDERHLKTKEIKETNNNKTREDESLIAFFEGMTGFIPPYDSTDCYTDDWLQPVQAIISQSSDIDQAEARLTWAIQEMRHKRYTIKSPKSCLTMALNWQDGKPSPNGHSGNGRIDKNAMKDSLWTIVSRSRDYTEAMERASPDEKKLLKAMGKWRDVRGLNQTTFQIRFYEVYNASH